MNKSFPDSIPDVFKGDDDEIYEIINGLFNKQKLKEYKEILLLTENGEKDEPWYSSSNISKSVRGVYGKLKEYGNRAKKTIKETLDIMGE